LTILLCTLSSFYYFFLTTPFALHYWTLLCLYCSCLGAISLAIFHFGSFFPPPFAYIGICEIKITIEFISTWAAGLVVFLVVRIFRSIQVSSEIVLVFFPKLVLAMLSLDELFHAGASFFAEGHAFDSRFYDFGRPSRWLIGAIWMWWGWLMMLTLFFLLAVVLALIQFDSFPGFSAVFLFLGFVVLVHLFLNITLRNHYWHIKIK